MYPLLEKLKAYGLKETGVNSWRSLCPCHNDKNPSFDIKLEGNKFLCHCFACDANGEKACEALDLPKQALFADYTGEAGRPFALEAQKVTPHNAQGGKLGLTLAEYAQAKGFSIDNLKTWGLEDFLWHSKKDGFACNAVKIPYYDENGFITKDNKGKDLSIRYRLTLTGADRFRWAYMAKPKNYLYGAQWAAQWPDDYICVVEGESDCHAGWSGGLVVVGLPGAGMWNEAKNAGLLARYKTIYVFIEGDTGGNTLYNSLTGADGKHKTTALIEKMRFVSIPADMGKDLSDVWRHFGGNEEEFRNYVFYDLFGSAKAYNGEIVTGAAGSADGRSATSRENGKAGGRPREKRDPSDIAELFYKRGGLYRYYRQVWYMYDGRKYRPMDEAEFRRVIMSFLKELRDADKVENAEAFKEWRENLDKNKEAFKPIREQEVKKSIADDVVSCLTINCFFGTDPDLNEPFRISTGEELRGVWRHCLNGFVNIDVAGDRAAKIKAGEQVGALDEQCIIMNDPDIFTTELLNTEFQESEQYGLIWEKWRDMLPDDSLCALCMMAGLALSWDRSLNVFFVLFGQRGGEGKSTCVIDPLKEIFGDCAANIPLIQFGENFGLSVLSEKSVNISDELPEDTKDGYIKRSISGILKQATGGAVGSFDEKYRPSRITARFTALNIFSCNNLRSYLASDSAMLDRLRIIEFKKRFRDNVDGKQDAELCKKLKEPKELTALFNIMLLGYNELKKHSSFPETQDGERRKEILRANILSNITKDYITDKYIRDDKLWLDMEKEYEKYKKYCMSYGLFYYNRISFTQLIEDTFEGAKQVKNGVEIKAVKGVGLKNYIDSEDF